MSRIYRGYILLRLSVVGSEGAVIKKLRELSSSSEIDGVVSYATPVYGTWDIVAECTVNGLEDLRRVVDLCKYAEGLSEYIADTTTLLGLREDYLPTTR